MMRGLLVSAVCGVAAYMLAMACPVDRHAPISVAPTAAAPPRCNPFAVVDGLLADLGGCP